MVVSKPDQHHQPQQQLDVDPANLRLQQLQMAKQQRGSSRSLLPQHVSLASGASSPSAAAAAKAAQDAANSPWGNQSAAMTAAGVGSGVTRGSRGSGGIYAGQTGGGVWPSSGNGGGTGGRSGGQGVNAAAQAAADAVASAAASAMINSRPGAGGVGTPGQAVGVPSQGMVNVSSAMALTPGGGNGVQHGAQQQQHDAARKEEIAKAQRR